jgi:spore germination protein KC
LFRKNANILVTFSLLIFTTLFLSGCWDRREVNDIAIVLATGIDKTNNNKIELSVQIIIPTAMGGGQQGSVGGGRTTAVKKATGTTIFDAMSHLQEEIPRYIFWGQNQIIVFGDTLAKEGIHKYIDFFVHHPSQRIRSFVFVNQGKAIDVLKTIPALERSSTEIPRELAKFHIGLSLTLRELLNMLDSEGESAAVPSIKVEKEPDGTSGVHLSGTAVFKKDKLKGFINDKVTRGVMWIRDEMKLSSVTVKPKGADALISFNLIHSNTKLIPKVENGKWKMTIKIVTEDDMVENQTTLNVSNPKVSKSLEKQLVQKINKRVRIALGRVQKEMKVDILGFAEVFHRYYPEEWSKMKGQWSDKFPEVEVEVDTKAYIRRPGMSTIPEGAPETEVDRN